MSFVVEDNVAFELTFRRLFKRLWPFIAKYPRATLKILVWISLYTAFGRAMPLIFGWVVDLGVNKGSLETVTWLAALFFTLDIARSYLAFFQSYSIQKLGNQILFDIRENLLRHVQNLSATYFDRTASGRIMTRVTNDVHSLGELFSQGFSTIFVSLIEISTILVALTLISARLTLMVALMIPFLLWACTRLSKLIRVRFGAAKRKLAMINAFTAESIAGMKVMQLFGRDKEARDNFNQLSGDYKELQLQTVRLFATLWPVVEAFNVSTVATSLLFGAYFRSSLALSPGSLAAYVLLVQGFFRPLRSILERYNQLQNSLASSDRVFQMFDVDGENHLGLKVLDQRLKGEIVFDHVTFRYTPVADPALRDISLTIRPGESVALVGRTGSGKTSMISLVQKLYPLEEGSIRLDGVSLREISGRSLRRRIGVVQQDNFMFRGTIADNISLANPEISRERILAAAERAQLKSLIESHELGLDALVQERGANLSAGERQLIAFARVLAFDPDILILDEATANIDSVHEKLIQEATTATLKGRTSLIIAHRLSTVMHCDRIVLLSHGQIVESGNHQELMAKKGDYFELYSAQVTADDSPYLMDLAGN